MGMSNLNNLTGHISHEQGFSKSKSELYHGGVSGEKRRSLKSANESQTFGSFIAKQKAAKDRRSFVTAELSKKGKVTFDVGDTVSFFAENLKPQEAVKAVKLLAELSKKDEVSFGIGEGNSHTVSFFAEKLEALEAVELIENIAQGNIDLKELSKQGWKEVKGESTGFINSVGELANETIISVAAGTVGGFLVAFFGPAGGILTGLGLAAMEKTIQGNYSFSAGILGGELSTLSGQVGAILKPR